MVEPIAVIANNRGAWKRRPMLDDSHRPRRPRYEILDGLRGIAAISVLIFHCGIVGRNPVLAPPRGYLAVDFFFVLSGFVIAHSYTHRLPRLGVAEFARIRVRRLLPLSMLGVLLGTAYLLVRSRVQPSSESPSQILSASLLNLVLVPGLSLPLAPSDEAFPTNIVLWSLSLEMVANFAWVFVAARVRAMLLIAAAGAAVLTLASWTYGHANVGWDLRTYWGGAGRAAFGFFAGVLLWHIRPPVRVARVRPWICAGALLGLLWVPPVVWWVDAVTILVGFPALLWLAISADYRPERSVFRLLGEVSYPLYVIHYPILMAMAGVLKILHPPGAEEWWIYGAATPIIGVAWLAGRFCDVPVRHMLERRPAGLWCK